MSGGPAVAVLSGASHGSGKAYAERLAADGMAVVLLHSPTGAEAARATAEELSATAPGVLTIQVDVGDERQVETAFAAVVDRFGRVDVVVNGAGYLRLDLLRDLTSDELDRAHRTLIRGVFLMCRGAAGRLSRGGVIVNLSSSATRVAVPGTSVFVAAKAAVEAITPVLAAELEERGIGVYSLVVEPSPDEATMLGLGPVGPPSVAAGIIGRLAEGRGPWPSGSVIDASSES